MVENLKPPTSNFTCLAEVSCRFTGGSSWYLAGMSGEADSSSNDFSKDSLSLVGVHDDGGVVLWIIAGNLFLQMVLLCAFPLLADVATHHANAQHRTEWVPSTNN